MLPGSRWTTDAAARAVVVVIVVLLATGATGLQQRARPARPFRLFATPQPPAPPPRAQTHSAPRSSPPPPPFPPSSSSEFNEIGSSLITLLNLAQEISSSSNVRFRQAADKLRQQFARSFSIRYGIEKSQFLSAALASIDGDDKLSADQQALRDTVLAQLRGIERRASSIIFFNEPLPNLDEYKHPFDYPYSALESPRPLTIAAVSANAVPAPTAEAAAEGPGPRDVNDKDKAAQKRNAQYVQDLLERFKGADDGKARLTDRDLMKLKLGLQIEARKWRSEVRPVPCRAAPPAPVPR